MKTFKILPLIGMLAIVSCEQKVNVVKEEPKKEEQKSDPTKNLVGASLVGYDGKALQNSVKRVTNLAGKRDKDLEKAMEDQ